MNNNNRLFNITQSGVVEVAPQDLIRLLQERLRFINVKRVRLCKQSELYRHDSLEVDFSVKT